jgi:hypothetical protein
VLRSVRNLFSIISIIAKGCKGEVLMMAGEGTPVRGQRSTDVVPSGLARERHGQGSGLEQRSTFAILAKYVLLGIGKKKVFLVFYHHQCNEM